MTTLLVIGIGATGYVCGRMAHYGVGLFEALLNMHLESRREEDQDEPVVKGFHHRDGKDEA